jgi:nicotinate-nucleotide--dimethylbenzimidazole phosphoribosyltransferase
VTGDAAAAAASRQAQLVKPPGSLGRLEEVVVWLAGLVGDPMPMPDPVIVIAAADHGVASAGVSAYPQEVTARMVEAIRAGGAASSAMAAHLGCPLWVDDAGVGQPSADLALGPALTRTRLDDAIARGRSLAGRAARHGHNLIVGGEMGIGNTTPATCLAAWLTGAGAELCGPGSGLAAAGLHRKKALVERALDLHTAAIDGPVEALRRLGGEDIAVLCGLALGAGQHGLGYVCDGVIATAAAAVAVAIEPRLRSHLVAGHRSPEPAHARLLEHLDLRPLLDLGMRLGEATGAATAVTILNLACAVHRDMWTFAEAGVPGPSGSCALPSPS